MKELSKFKVLSITLLMTMSCVGGAIDINAETLRAYGFELDITSADHVQSVLRNKKSKTQHNNNKFRFTDLVKSGRNHFAFKGLTIDYSPVAIYLSIQYFAVPLVNQRIRLGNCVHKQSYKGVSFLNRAGPFSILS